MDSWWPCWDPSQGKCCLISTMYADEGYESYDDIIHHLSPSVFHSRWTRYLILWVVRTSSGGINPARDMGPRLVTVFGHWGRAAMTDWFPYILGPLIGGPVGAFLADRVLFL